MSSSSRPGRRTWIGTARCFYDRPGLLPLSRNGIGEKTELKEWTDPMDDLHRRLEPYLREGRLPCATAFDLARKWRIAPLALAEQSAEAGVRIGWCQLGLFVGARKGEKGWPAGPLDLPPGVEEALRGALEEGCLPCARAWALAKRLGLERLPMGQMANSLGVRISRCQLGCF